MRGSMLSLSTNGGGDNMSVGSSTMTMPRRLSSNSSSSARTRNVHRSQSTHSKRSPMPSLQESDYVNTDVIQDFIKDSEEQEQRPKSSEERPKSVAEISQKENVCNIKIVDDSKVQKPKRSASSVKFISPYKVTIMKIILNFSGINDKTPSETKWQSISIAWHWRAPNDQCCRHWFRTILHARKQHQSSIGWTQGSTTRSPTQNWWQRKIQIFGRFAHGKRTSHGSSQSVSLCSQNMNFHAKNSTLQQWWTWRRIQKGFNCILSKNAQSHQKNVRARPQNLGNHSNKSIFAQIAFLVARWPKTNAAINQPVSLLKITKFRWWNFRNQCMIFGDGVASQNVLFQVSEFGLKITLKSFFRKNSCETFQSDFQALLSAKPRSKNKPFCSILAVPPSQVSRRIQC